MQQEWRARYSPCFWEGGRAGSAGVSHAHVRPIAYQASRSGTCGFNLFERMQPSPQAGGCILRLPSSGSEQLQSYTGSSRRVLREPNLHRRDASSPLCWRATGRICSRRVISDGYYALEVDTLSADRAAQPCEACPGSQMLKPTYVILAASHYQLYHRGDHRSGRWLVPTGICQWRRG